MGTIDRVERVVAPVVASSGLELVDVETRPGTVRVTVDRAGGVDLDTLGAVTGAISRALDEHDVVPGGRYELEVSSPGVERRLRRPDHFRAHVGASVAVRTRAGVDGLRRLEGVLTEAGEETFRLEGEAIPGGARELSYGDVERAHTVFDWRAALAGTGTTSSRRQHKAERRRALHEQREPAHQVAGGRDDETDETETR
ncbi:MAG TPA: ribosome maturation factor RimP [Acidimicrobiales bacterium]|nr:ribosome maturation factor RimP [Acidimicrobiales bacterium]